MNTRKIVEELKKNSGGKDLNPIHINEIPTKIKECVNQIDSIRFPKQGCTSDVGILETGKGRFALKRTKNPL